MGIGKTSFARGLIKSYYKAPELIVTSPTFILDNEYEIDNKILHHIDLYRLDDYNDCISLDIVKLFNCKDIVLMEWSEVLGNNLPDEYIKVKLQLNENDENRKVEITIHPETLQLRLDEWIKCIDEECFIESIKKI